MPQYIHDNADDEISHARFLNAYLMSKGHEPVNFDRFRTLPSSTATGADPNGINSDGKHTPGLKRLTNLTQLTIDLSFWARYRSIFNPDFGAKFTDQPVIGLNQGQHPAIPRDDTDSGMDPTSLSDDIKAIAFTAGFHFAFIEQGGTSLYPTLAQRVHSREVLRILLSIGGSEIMHFQTWQDKAGNAKPLSHTVRMTHAPVTFMDLTTGQPETLQANLIMPEPCDFLSPNLPKCAIIRPTGPEQVDAVNTAQGFKDDGLFIGQSDEFLDTFFDLAEAADRA
jgi:hypothetical protein